MKQRDGFVSNSSSSSFIIHKKGLTDKQLEELRAYVKLFNCLGGECEAGEYSNDNLPYDYEDYDDVDIFQFYIDYCLYDNEILKFFKQKYGNNVDLEWD